MDLTVLEAEVLADPVDTPAASPAMVDGKAMCPDCGKTLTVTAAGNLRKHKCADGITTVDARQPRKAVARKKAPAGVRRLAVSVIGGTTEWSAGAIVSRRVPCDVDDIPEEVITLPDADAMIGPLVDQAWPQIPPAGQRVLIALSDKEDLIAAVLAWSEYIGQLKRWAAIEHDRRLERTTDSERTDQIPQAIATGLGGGGFPLGLVTATDETL